MRRIALGLALAIGCVACRQESTTPRIVSDADLPADQIVYGLHHVMTNNGVRSAVLDGDTAYVHEEGDRLDLTGVELRFFTETGRESGHLTSDTGEYEVGAGLFTARGNVVLITEGPKGQRRLETEELFYQIETEDLWSDRDFVLVENGQTTRGASFRTDAQAQTWEVTDLETEGDVQSGGELSF